MPPQYSFFFVCFFIYSSFTGMTTQFFSFNALNYIARLLNRVRSQCSSNDRHYRYLLHVHFSLMRHRYFSTFSISFSFKFYRMACWNNERVFLISLTACLTRIRDDPVICYLNLSIFNYFLSILVTIFRFVVCLCLFVFLFKIRCW